MSTTYDKGGAIELAQMWRTDANRETRTESAKQNVGVKSCTGVKELLFGGKELHWS